MRKITIIYPDDCTEHEATLYAEGCFNPHCHDYKRERPEGKRHGAKLTFRDDREGLFYFTKSGYNLELIPKGVR
ncbi:MAG: hypothetical protein J6P40_07375 [Oscillospiraceae bacterium]|nr:hypothetical protein [Oscillospiraceae bacterium]